MRVQTERIIAVLAVSSAATLFCVTYGPWGSQESDRSDGPILQMPGIDGSQEAGIDDILFAELQIRAISIDMDRYLGWFPEDKKLMRKASVRAVRDLGVIRNYLRRPAFMGSWRELADAALAVVDTLIPIYDGIDSRQDDEIEQAFARLQGPYAAYHGKRKAAATPGISGETLPQDFAPREEVIKCAEDGQDRSSYVHACELLQSGKCVPAYHELTKLHPKYQDTRFAQCLAFRISQCMLMGTPDDAGTPVFDPEQGIALLSAILESRVYSPVLFAAFYRWRTETQSFWHGMSNTSEIPNLQYNLKRWQTLQTVRQYQKEHPEDAWARAQATLLLTLPNIGRGGLCGNDNLLYQDDE